MIRTILPSLEKYGRRITASGIRYGSVAYMAFGKGTEKHHQGRASTVEYEAEIEIGADEWLIESGDDLILSSSFQDVDEARDVLRSLNGLRLNSIAIKGGDLVMDVGGAITWRSHIASSPASGFLCSFHVADGQSWETLDGVLASS